MVQYKDIWERILLIANVSLLAAVLYLFLSPLPAPRGMESAEAFRRNAQDADVFAEDSGRLLMPVLTDEDYRYLTGRDLFGIERRAAIAEPAGIEEVQEDPPMPEIQLMGTIAGGNAISRALIKNPEGGGERLYRVGDRVGGATLRKIGPRTITLERDGHSYEVSMDFTAGSSAASDRLEQAERPATAERSGV